MNQLIENTFRKIGDKKYVTVNRQVWLAIMGGIGFIFVSIFIFQGIFECFRERTPGFSLGYVVIYIIGGGMMLLFVAMGLFSITTEIDFSTRRVRITKRNIRGAHATSEASIDDLCISAVRMGVSDSAPHGAWIVRAGFLFEGENGEDNSVAIWSKEVDKEQNIKERNEIMFELYRFFFPDRPPVTEENFITNGTVVMLLSDQEKEDFLKKSNEPPRLQIARDELKKIQKKNWDKLIS